MSCLTLLEFFNFPTDRIVAYDDYDNRCTTFFIIDDEGKEQPLQIKFARNPNEVRDAEEVAYIQRAVERKLRFVMDRQ